MKRLHPEHFFLFLSYALYLAAGIAVWVAMGGGFAPPDDSALILAAFLLLTAPLAAALFLKKEKSTVFFAALTLFSLVKNLFLTLAELLLDYNNIYFPTRATRSVCILVFVGAGALVCAAELAAIVLAKWRKRAE